MTARGILMAGGSGSRLGPLTAGTTKHLLPVHDKPMIFHPLALLIAMGVREVLLVSAPDDVDAYRRLLGDGSAFGIALHVTVQEHPRGLAEAFLLGEDFIDHQPVVLALGDNVLHVRHPGRLAAHWGRGAGARVFATAVPDPSRFGVVALDASGRPTSLEEKPDRPASSLAVPGLYLYDEHVVEVARTVEPSARGELEITTVNRAYLERGGLQVSRLPRSTVWHDAGTVESLRTASEWVRDEQARTGRWVGVPEEAAWRVGLLDDDALRARGGALLPSAYGQHLLDLPGRATGATRPAPPADGRVAVA